MMKRETEKMVTTGYVGRKKGRIYEEMKEEEQRGKRRS
jgi:hypothetical protein